MAKLKIGASSTVCGAAKHDWKPMLAPNYRQCAQCHTVEVLRDGQWVSPTGRGAKQHSSGAAAPASSLIQVSDRDLQAKMTRLAELPASKSAATTVSPSHSSTVSGDDHLRAMTRRNRGDMLYKWGQEHGFPQFRVQLPDRVHTIVAGMAVWRMTCYQGPLEVVEAAIEQSASKGVYEDLPELVEAERAQRLALIELGRARNWARFVWKATNPGSDLAFSMVLDGGERGWTRYAYNGRYEHICQVCALLVDDRGVHVERSTAPGDLDEVRDRFLARAKEAGYPVLHFRVADDGIVYKMAKGGQAEYEDRAGSATVGWLWNAVQALEKQYGLPTKKASDGVMERARQDLKETVARHEAERVQVRTEQWYRARLVLVGRERGWTKVVCVVQSADEVEVTVGPGEKEWCDFALHGDSVRVAEVYDALEKEAVK
jgi:hypothetical protein